MFLNAIETFQVICKTNQKMPPLILHVIKVSLEDNILRNVRTTIKYSSNLKNYFLLSKVPLATSMTSLGVPV